MSKSIILNADLYDNPLTERTNDFTAKPRNTGTLYNSDIATRISEKNSEFKTDTILTILNLADKEKCYAVGEGKSVVDGVASYRVNIKGPFDGADAQFDSSKHSLGVTFTMGKTLRDILDNEVQVAIHGVSQAGPVVNTVADAVTNRSTSESYTGSFTITSGGALTINGTNLKIQGDSDENGVYFVPATGEPVKVTVLISNNPSKLIVQMPALSDGKYTLRVTTQYSNGKTSVKDPRSYDYPIALQVGAGGEDDDDDGPVIQ